MQEEARRALNEWIDNNLQPRRLANTKHHTGVLAAMFNRSSLGQNVTIDELNQVMTDRGFSTSTPEKELRYWRIRLRKPRY